MTMKPIQVGLLGIGTVGSGVFNVLQRNQDEISRRAGRGIEIAMVADLDVERAKSVVGSKVQVVNDARAVIANPDIDIVIELIGGYGVAKATACALRDAGFTHGTIVARNEQTGRQLAELYGFAWQADTAGLEADLLLNTTPIGMPGSPEEAELAFTEAHIAAARVVFDMVAAVSGTPLIHAANAAGKTVIRGTEVFALQAVEQFVLYTGIRTDAELFAQAAAHARQQPVA